MRKIHYADRIGTKFNSLLILESIGERFLCLCDCGVTKSIRSGHVISGSIVNCGCIKQFKHRRTGTALYKVFTGMVQRCHNPKSYRYDLYGGRGISVCDEWRNDNRLFFKWCEDNGWEKGLDIDRIDNYGNYSPDNCRIVTHKANARNKRNTIFIEYDGKRKSLADWADELSMKYTTLRCRVQVYGWSIEEALLIKPNVKKN